MAKSKSKKSKFLEILCLSLLICSVLIVGVSNYSYTPTSDEKSPSSFNRKSTAGMTWMEKSKYLEELIDDSVVQVDEFGKSVTRGMDIIDSIGYTSTTDVRSQLVAIEKSKQEIIKNGEEVKELHKLRLQQEERK